MLARNTNTNSPTSPSDVVTPPGPNPMILELDHMGGAKALASIEDCFPLRPDSDRLIWVRCYLNEQTSALLTSLNVMSSQFVNMLCAPETRPSTFSGRDGFVGIFRSVSPSLEKTTLQNKEAASIRLFINKNVIVMVQLNQLVSVDRLQESLVANVGPVTSADFIVSLLNEITDRISEVITLWDNTLDQLENDTQITSNSDQSTLILLRKGILILRRYLIPQREAIAQMEPEKLSWFDTNNQAHLSEIAQAMIRLVEDLETEKDRVEALQDSLSSQSQQDTNLRTYYLSIIASIFLPISFATGLLGSNLAGIPFATKPWSFPAFCLLLLLIAVGIALFLRYRKWF